MWELCIKADKFFYRNIAYYVIFYYNYIGVLYRRKSNLLSGEKHA